MKLIRPITEENRNHLAAELEAQKRKFFEATKRSAEELKTEFRPDLWIKDSPLRSAWIILGIGYLAGQALQRGKTDRNEHRNKTDSNSGETLRMTRDAS